jgi:crotonobetainyl-CoA:carnitine CoA-transferase CaiB-like acyl-CoA transferase
MTDVLEGIKVLDFSTNAAGPLACGMLADYGAYVVKIEKPKTGADERAFGVQVAEGKSLVAAWLNRGKKSVTMDLKDPEAIAIIKRMIPDFDVLLENNRPGVMAKLGLDYETLHAISPRLIYCSISAFGQTGLYAQKPGYDILAQAMSGIMDITGYQDGPPTKHGTVLGDYFGGMNGFTSILTALIYQQRTGRGQHIDVSLLHGLLFLNSVVDYLNIGQFTTRSGNHHPALCPYGLFQGTHGQSLIIAAVNPKMWASLCNVMKRPELIDDTRYDGLQKRCKRVGEVVGIIEDWLAGFEEITEAQKLLEEIGVPCCKVYNVREVLEDPHISSNGYYVEAEAPSDFPVKTYRARYCNAKFSETPGKIRRGPALGEHNNEVLEQYGLSAAEVDALQARWGA